jgi:hypothetical protein
MRNSSSTTGFARSHRARRGGALALALIVAVTVAAASAGILLVSTHFARRQANTVHDMRAFYVAEAGLSEAYNALTIGQTGQIGSMEAPARSGEGLLWVDATELADGNVRLESTGLVGLGRASLALVVERVEQPLGIFADEDLIIDAPILVDGYDSEAAPYEEQVVAPGVVAVLRKNTGLTEETPPYEGALIVSYEDVEFLVVGETETEYLLQLYDTDDGDLHMAVGSLLKDSLGQAPVGEMPIDWANLNRSNTDRIHKHFEQWGLPWPPAGYDDGSGWGGTSDAPAGGTTGLGVHTSGAGKLASNGNITFTGTAAEIYGDVVPGPEGEVLLGSGTHVTGSTAPRSDTLELPTVTQPAVEMQPAVEYGGAAPMVIPPSTIGYESLTVLSDAEVIVRGPSTLVLGDFELEERAVFQVDNLDGPVDLYVIRSARLVESSEFFVHSEDPSQLTLRFVGASDPVQLASTSAFRGMIYGPDAAIAVEAPFEVFGVLVGNTLDLGAGVRLHFDAGIAGGADRLNLPRLISWDVTEVPPEIRAHRMDPFEALGLDRDELEQPVDAGETNTWALYMKYTPPGTNKKVDYDGPYHEFDWSEVDWWTSQTLTPPDTQFAQPWTMVSRYLLFNGTEKTYDGPVADFPIATCGRELERTLTPPPELAELGVFYATFTVP